MMNRKDFNFLWPLGFWEQNSGVRGGSEGGQSFVNKKVLRMSMTFFR